VKCVHINVCKLTFYKIRLISSTNTARGSHLLLFISEPCTKTGLRKVFKSKVVPVPKHHSIMTYRRRRAPGILDGSEWSRFGRFIPNSLNTLYRRLDEPQSRSALNGGEHKIAEHAEN
jgi:hypothetical protein